MGTESRVRVNMQKDTTGCWEERFPENQLKTTAPGAVIQVGLSLRAGLSVWSLGGQLRARGPGPTAPAQASLGPRPACSQGFKKPLCPPGAHGTSAPVGAQAGSPCEASGPFPAPVRYTQREEFPTSPFSRSNWHVLLSQPATG